MLNKLEIFVLKFQAISGDHGKITQKLVSGFAASYTANMTTNNRCINLYISRSASRRHCEVQFNLQLAYSDNDKNITLQCGV